MRYFLIVAVWAGVAVAEKPAPPVGPGPAGVGPAARVVDPEEAEHRRVSEAMDLEGRADLMRAEYERAHRPGGGIADPAMFEKVVAAYRAAIDRDPRGGVGTYCRQRLAGAYTYVGDFDGGLRILTEAVNAAVGPADQVVACHGVALHCLQAMHRPAEAIRWYNRAASMIPKIEDEQARAKWAVATAQGVARCEAEMKR
jgi:tetratricopeptide (TPR) repeat protein